MTTPVRGRSIARLNRPLRPGCPQLVIFDVDNTLFDWVGVWYGAFSALLDSLAPAAARRPVERSARELLLTRFRTVHRRHGSTEYPFALGELSSLGDGGMLPPFTIAALAEAAACHRSAARARLGLYPGVADTLAWLRASGTRIVAFTETRLDVSAPRLRRLGLDGIVDRLYAPAPWLTHAARRAAAAAQATLWPHGEPPLVLTACVRLDAYAKPQAEALQVILDDAGVAREQALYVGDHLEKDVVMAQAAQVPVVWARYGTHRRPHEMALLDRVCHWDVAVGRPAAPAAAPFAIDHPAELRGLCDRERWPPACIRQPSEAAPW